MTTFTTFYLSRIIGKKAIDPKGKSLGIIKDLLIDTDSSTGSGGRPIVKAVKLKHKSKVYFLNFENFSIMKSRLGYQITCNRVEELNETKVKSNLALADSILDKQIVDMNGRKLVRVNDVRLVSVASGTYALAVDIGIEGLLRRIGISAPINAGLAAVKGKLPSKFILWEDVEAIDFRNLNIKLSKTYTKLEALHPSDLADIIEDMGRKESTEVFSALDEEKAADVLEEMEVESQVHIIESLPVEKAADVLEKMPADEAADILDELEAEKAEQLLNEMEKDASEEVRELLGYPENAVGSIMSTEILSFRPGQTVQDVFTVLRDQKPEAETLYNLFVTDEKETLLATFSLRDLVISSPDTALETIMKPSPVRLHDRQKIDDIAEYVSKYNLLAIPVVDDQDLLQGMVVIDDVVDDLMDKGRTNK